MATDETTEGTDAPIKEKSSMDDQSKKIKQAGIEETPAGETLEEETAPEPKAKSMQELNENPHDSLDVEDHIPDPLSVDGTKDQPNGEMLESMKNKNADGDVKIPNGAHKFSSPGEEVASEEAYHGHVITVIRSHGQFKVVVDGQECHSLFGSSGSAKAEGRRLVDTDEYLNLMVNTDVVTRMGAE